VITLARRAPRASRATATPLASERRIIQALIEAHDDARRRHPLIVLGINVALSLIVVKAIATAAAWVAGYPIAPPSAPLAPAAYALLFAGFAGIGVPLAVLGRNRRTTALGAVFIIVALAFSREVFRQVPLPAWLSDVLQRGADPLLPLFLWLFVTEFPHRGSGLIERVAAAFAAISTVFAFVMLLSPAIWTTAAYWGMTFALTALALPALALRARAATGADRMRVRWFGAGLLIGFAPLALEVLAASLSPAFARWSERPDVMPVLGFVVAGALLTIPLTTSYAVVTRHVVDVDWVVRRAARSRLAKAFVVVAALTPLVVLGAVAYAQRTRTVAEIAREPVVAALLGLTAAGTIVLIVLERLFRFADRIFQQPHDAAAAAILSDFAASAPTAANTSALGVLVCRTIRTALAPSRVRIAMSLPSSQGHVDSDTGRLVFGYTSELIEVLARAREPVIDISDTLLRVMTREEAAWMAAGLVEQLAPIRTSDGYVVGVVTLSAREDERPYTADDRQIVERLLAIAATSAERLELRRRANRRHAFSLSPDDLPPAAECARCGAVYPPTDTGTCGVCDEPLRRACVPYLIGGKLRVERCAGRGGMSVVYAAVDETLDRRVAVKALPYVSGAAEQRLRHEAQTMARVAHVNVAAVFGLESWNRRPLVIVEFLEGGTLAERLRVPASVPEVVGWGLALADGLAQLHRDGLLHGDIKPSNIGFDRNGIPKLLDFGLAQSYLPSLESPFDSGLPEVRLGTRSYLCPDAAGAAPRPEFDLWSLALVLYQALAVRPDMPAALAEFFSRALHSRPELRPRSATEFSLGLRRAGAIG
jgi:hypothetical protein